MVMNNIFENAYFGKAYKTRNGRKAILLQKTFDYDGITQRGFIVATNDWKGIYSSYPIDMDGKMQCWSNQRPEDISVGGDLISEWQEHINDEKLDEITKEYLQLNVLYRCDECEQMFIDMIGEAYKAGYRKATEE